LGTGEASCTIVGQALDGNAAFRPIIHFWLKLHAGRATNSTPRITVLLIGLSTPGFTCHQ
jgi:hypothetical protein